MPPLPDALLFGAIAAAMTVLALFFFLPRLFGRNAPPTDSGRERTNAAVHRGNLDELDREHDAGRLTDGQYAEARTELEHRLLADSSGDPADGVPRDSPRGVALLLLVLLPTLAFALYVGFGDPRAIDEATRGEDTTPASVSGRLPARAELVAHLERHARDGRAWVLLARVDFAADRYADAAAAYAKALAVTPKVAADAGIHCEYADALGMAAGGSLAGAPRGEIALALALDPTHPKALEMAGSAAVEQGEFALAARYWRRLLGVLPEGSASYRQLAAAIAQAESVAATAPGESPTK
jgi:cytochrome c-type biogenesis protein CcmH